MWPAAQLNTVKMKTGVYDCGLFAIAFANIMSIQASSKFDEAAS